MKIPSLDSASVNHFAPRRDVSDDALSQGVSRGHSGRGGDTSGAPTTPSTKVTVTRRWCYGVIVIVAVL